MKKLATSLRVIGIKIRKLAAKFHFMVQHSDEGERTFRTLSSLIKNNDGIFKNPNIVYYLKEREYTPDELELIKDQWNGPTVQQIDKFEGDLEKEIQKNSKPSDIGCVVTSIRLNAEKFRGKFRSKEDAFIYDAEGIRIHFKVKNKYPEQKYEEEYEDRYTGEKTKRIKTRVTQVFSSLEMMWERTPATQEKIEASKATHADWFEQNKDKIEVILKDLPENTFNRRYLSDLRENKKIEDSKLEKLYDEAIAQSRPSFNGSGKNKTVIKIVHVGMKDSPSFRPGGGTDTKSQVIGISQDFKQKVVVKFGLRTRASDQLAQAADLPRVSAGSPYFVSIQTPTCIRAHLGSFTTELLSVTSTEIKVKLKPDQNKWDEASKELDDLKKGDSVRISIGFYYPALSYEGDAKILERSGDLFTFKNPMIESDQPYEDIHENADKLIGKKVTVEGEFKSWNDVIFVTRPKFTKA